MEISLWDIATIISKLMIYLGISGSVGGVFMYGLVIKRQYPVELRLHCQYLIVIGILATLLNFFIQVGAFAESGLLGMFEPLYLSMLWQSNAGDALIYRLAGFALALLAVYKGITTERYRRVFIVSYILSALLLVRSFSVIGHTADLVMASQWLLSLHVLLIAWWVGSLWPLWLACEKLSVSVLHNVMQQFGHYASYLVSLLMICGFTLGYLLLGSVEALFISSYGQSLLFKLALVIGILLIAARHKFKLVADLLTSEQGKENLARSIRWEMILALSILLTTTWLTTVVGPSH